MEALSQISLVMVLISRVTWAQSAVNMLSCEITAHIANVLDFSSCAVLTSSLHHPILTVLTLCNIVL